MISIHTFLERLSSTKSKKEKLAIISTLGGYAECAKEVIEYALNPFKRFNITVKKYPALNPELDWAFTTNRWVHLKSLLDKLASREVSGNDAKFAVARWMDIPSAAPILARILNKDLRAGVSKRSFNKMHPKMIPSFDVALASPDQSKIKYPCWGEPKYDGVRLLTIIDGDGNAQLLSRNGKQYNNFLNIKSAIEARKLKSVVLDGETRGLTFDNVMEVAHRKPGGKDDSDLQYIIFDYLPLSVFQDMATSEPFTQRRSKMMNAILGANKPSSAHLGCISGKEIADEQEMLEYYQECLDYGHEGIILKDPDAVYAYKRTNSWIKVKPELEIDAEVVGFFSGEQGKRLEETLGGLIVEYNGVNTEVGTGFSDTLRDEIWNNRDNYINRVVEVKAGEITKDGKLRFPRFFRWREDKD